jgi:hypothetical protein
MTIEIACSKGSGENEGSSTPSSSCASTPAKFSSDINPIIQSNCASSSGCHGIGSFNGPGALTTFNQIKNAASAIRSAVVSKRMPLGGSLTDAQIQSIACWADNGALNN